MSSVRAVLALWRVWILGIAMTAMFIFSYVSPAMGGGIFYEVMFGGAALVSFGYGIRSLRDDGYGS